MKKNKELVEGVVRLRGEGKSWREVGRMNNIKIWPNKIYLQLEDWSETDFADFVDDEATWCKDQINDVKYIRADIVDMLREALQKAEEAMRLFDDSLLSSPDWYGDRDFAVKIKEALSLIESLGEK